MERTEGAQESSPKEARHAKGTLYLAATPIGNLEDMTLRAVRILKEVPLIAAEDTRHTRKLLARYDIHTRLLSYHEHNKFEKGPRLVEFLLAGNDLVCVSDAGLPGIADPGSHLATLAIDAGVAVSPLPGANAALSALICSGLDTRRFTFVGFLPRTAAKRSDLLAEVAARRETLIFYEAPHHLKDTLKALASAFGGARPAAAARELTKRYEEFRRGRTARRICPRCRGGGRWRGTGGRTAGDAAGPRRALYARRHVEEGSHARSGETAELEPSRCVSGLAGRVKAAKKQAALGWKIG